MRNEIWYREELIVLRALVEEAIGRQDPSDVSAMSALGGLHLKLEEAIPGAPGASTPEGAA